MTLYFNENEPYCTAWLRNLYPEATVDERSVTDVRAADVRSAHRAHFFAGIAGWEYALELAGWPAEWPIWTGSCPCQPFSAAGKRKGTSDERHLWPEFHRLIRDCLPPVVFGEQVASADGREWLSGVRADLENLGYAVGAADLCAAGASAPHLRQRLYWVAYLCGSGLAQRQVEPLRGEQPSSERGGDAGRLADVYEVRCRSGQRRVHGSEPDSKRGSTVGGVADDHGKGRGIERGLRVLDGERAALGDHADGRSTAFRLGVSSGVGRREERPQPGGCFEGGRSEGGLQRPWDNFDVVYCRDGKYRRIEPGTFPLADGVPAKVERGQSALCRMARRNKVGRLKAYGNAIVPRLAAQFISAVIEVLREDLY